jgi:cytochrome c5
MKTLLSVLVLLAIMVNACNKKTVATRNVAVTATDVPSGPTPDMQPAEPSKSNSELEAASYLAAGKTVYETKCTRCHSLKLIDLYTTDRWDTILKLMAPKAKLTESETVQVTAYLKANAKK